MQYRSLLSSFSKIGGLGQSNHFGAIFALSSSLVLAACGGGGNSVTENSLTDPGADGVAPTLISVTMFNEESRFQHAKTGDVVEVSFTASESIQLPTVTIGGLAATVSGSTKSWQAKRTMTAADADGMVAFEISFTDISGEQGTAVTASTLASNDEGSKTAGWAAVELCADGSCIVIPVVNKVLDFETANQVYTWKDIGTPEDIVPGDSSLVQDPADPTNTVVLTKKYASGLYYNGTWVSLGDAADPDFTVMLSNADAVMSMRLRSPSVGREVRMKLEVANNSGVFVEAKTYTSVADEWETLYFDFANPSYGTLDPTVSYSAFFVMYDFALAGAGADQPFYYDDITHGGVTSSGPVCAPAGTPTDAAPAAKQLSAANVVSVYSSAFTDIESTNFNPAWGQNTVYSEEQIASDATLKYANLNYQGINLGSADGGVGQDVSAMDVLHLNYWTSSEDATLEFFLISIGDGEEKAFELPVTSGSWGSIDIPLTEFSSVVDLTEVHQFKIVASGNSCAANVFLDNIYFCKDCDLAPAPTPTAATGDVLSIFSDAYDDLADTNFNPDWGQGNAVAVANGVMTYSGLDYQGTNLGSADGVAQDVSGYGSFHVDFYTEDSTSIDFFLISNAGGVTAEVAYSLPITAGEWVSLDIPLTEWSGVVDLTSVFQIKVAGNGTVKWDNWYFCNGCLEDTSSAPTPTAAAANVLSIFSDTYTDLADSNFNPDWGQGNVTTVADGVLTYTGLDYQGTNLGGADGVSQDVSGFSSFHLDFYSDDSTSLDFFLISNAGGVTAEVAYSLPITTGEWVSLDIPLSEWSAVVDMTSVFQIKVAGNGTVKWDNWYFCTGCVAPTPTAAAEDVLSIFSDAYTDLADSNFNPDWGQGNVTTVAEGVLTYTGLDYQGTNLGGADGVPQDVSGYASLHVDFYTEDSTSLDFFLISNAGGVNAEVAYSLPITAGEWVSLDIPLTEWSSVVDLTSVYQIKVAGNGTVAWDNLYFKK